MESLPADQGVAAQRDRPPGRPLGLPVITRDKTSVVHGRDERPGLALGGEPATLLRAVDELWQSAP